ncbi:MAG: cyanophycin synthetase [Gemmataceae bacterium]|nr:cyanophycin synthetase [Gemmataceae bacterium]
MRIVSFRAFPGPNVYLHRPILRATVALEDLDQKESSDFDGFVERLLVLLPGLRQHHCAKGEPGGFVERLHGGTYFGHVAEHCAIEMGQMAGGVLGNWGKTVRGDEPGVYHVHAECRNEAAGRFLITEAVGLVMAVLEGRGWPVAERVEEARRIAASTELGPSTRAVVDAAERRGIPWVRLNEGSLVQLGQGVHRRLIQATESHLTGDIAVDIACDKALTKRLLDQAGVPVPHGAVVRTEAEALAALEELRPPLAVKPLDGNQGRGISLRVATAERMAEAFAEASRLSREVIVEEFFEGRDYRAVVVGGKLVAASERVPAHVVGDGVRTVAELAEIENRDPMRGEGHEKPLTRLALDAQAEACLGRQGLGWSSVPAAGQRALLRETANLSTGGTARDVTDDVHPEVARMCERAARLIGLDICGLDLILPDISLPVPESGAGVIEANAAPGIRMHHYPTEGTPRDVGAAIVGMLYPHGDGRIPIATVTGTNGKTTVARMIAHALRASGKVVGLTTTDGIWIDGRLEAKGDLTGFNSARAVLADPLVEAAVLETARGGIVRRGLGYDWSDVGVLTNIQEDHLGQDGIETVDDLLWIKSLVAERVREGGTLVLNADDPRLAALPDNPRLRKVRQRVVYFSLHPENETVRRHLEAGGTACLLERGWLVEAQGQSSAKVVREAALPTTLGGAAKFQTANALAALAACRAMGLKREQAGSALASFQSGRDNQGRMNLYRVGKGHLVVDYGHNPSAFEALCGLTSQWSDRRVTGILTAPGDRDDKVVRDVGRVAAGCFDRVIIREDEDARGRRRGEVAEMIRRAVLEEETGKDCRVILDETEALVTALEEMEEDEVVVLFFEKRTEPSLEVLKRFGGRPASTLEPRVAQTA